MKDEVLCEVTTSQLETGLRGIPVGYCVTSKVDPQKGLFYMKTAVSELTDWEPERVIALLYFGRDLDEKELQTFKEELRSRATCSPKLLYQITQLPREGHPMELFPTALLIAGMVGLQGDYREDCLEVIAKIPHLTAAVINHHAGWGKTADPDPSLGYMENFVHLLNLPEKKEGLVEAMRLFNILHYDHGGGNLSAFVGKTIASGLEDLYGSLAGAMCALAGPRHGAANQESLRFVKEAMEALGTKATLEEVANYIEGKLERKELIFGFGHAVLRVEDPRATVQYALAEETYAEDPLVRMALLLRTAVPEVLKRNPKIQNPYPNVDAISASLLSAAGFPYSEYHTLLFGMARVVGIAIQIVYERCEAREGRGTPIVRPKYLFKERNCESV